MLCTRKRPKATFQPIRTLSAQALSPPFSTETLTTLITRHKNKPSETNLPSVPNTYDLSKGKYLSDKNVAGNLCQVRVSPLSDKRERAAYHHVYTANVSYTMLRLPIVNVKGLRPLQSGYTCLFILQPGRDYCFAWRGSCSKYSPSKLVWTTPPPPKTQRDRHYLERILFCPSRNSQVAPRLFFLLISHVDSVLSTLRNCYVFPRNILSPPCQRRAAVFLIKISISSQVRFLYVFLLNTKKGFGQTFNSHRIPQCREPLRCRHNKLLTRLLVSRSTGWRPRRQ